VKEELAGIRLTPETIKTTCEGVIRDIAMEEFVAAVRRWLDRFMQQVRADRQRIRGEILRNKRPALLLTFYLTFSI
jgi:hypothetical protein